MSVRVLAIAVVGLLTAVPVQPGSAARRISWADTESVRVRLEGAGLSASAFPAYIERIHREILRRVREGDFDHLVFYILQSTHFTRLPPIEPALSAKSFTEGGGVPARDRID